MAEDSRWYFLRLSRGYEKLSLILFILSFLTVCVFFLPEFGFVSLEPYKSNILFFFVCQLPADIFFLFYWVLRFV